MLDPPGLLGVPTKSQVPRQAGGWGYLSSPQLLIPAAQGQRSTSPPHPIFNFLVCPGLSEAPGTIHTRCHRRHRLHDRGPSPAQLGGKGNGQERRTLSRPCGFPAPGGWLLQWPRLRMREMAPGAPGAGQGLRSGRDRGDGGAGSSPL